MEKILQSKRLLDIVLEKETRLFWASEHQGFSSEELEELRKAALTYPARRQRARVILINSLDDRPLRAVQGATDDPEAVWKKLDNRYADKSCANCPSVPTTLYSKRYVPGDIMEDYIDSLESLMNKLAALGTPVTEEMKVRILLGSLADDKELESMTAALKTQKKITWGSVAALLLEE